MAGVEAKEISLPVNGGSLTALDFGGTGHPVLLVHGSGHNAAAWTDVAFHLTDYCRVVQLTYVDMAKPGSTPETPNSTGTTSPAPRNPRLGKSPSVGHSRAVTQSPL